MGRPAGGARRRDRLRPAGGRRCCSCSGLRLRGPTLGIALAYAWVSYPFTLYALESNTNDMLVAALRARGAAVRGLAARARGVRGAGGPDQVRAARARAAARDPRPARAAGRAPPARRSRCSCWRSRSPPRVVCIPALTHDSLHTIYERTIVYQANRGSPFSVWGLYGGLQRRADGGRRSRAVALALALAVLPRRADIVGLAAAARRDPDRLQLGVEHWFYLYIPWFFALVMIALLGAAPPSARLGLRRVAGRPRHQHLLDRVGPQRLRAADERRPFSQGSSSEVSKRTGIWVTSASTACSRLTPITPPRGPVMPTSVM